MPAAGFRFRAYADQRTLGALRAQLRLACEIYNALRRADIDFYHRNGRGPTLTELRQLALDLRERNEDYRQLRSQVAQEIADRFHNAGRRFLEGVRNRLDPEFKFLPILPSTLREEGVEAEMYREEIMRRVRRLARSLEDALELPR